MSMKVANIIVAHKGPTQLERLVKTFPQGHYHCFVHLDGRCRESDFSGVLECPHVTSLPRRRRLVYTGFGFVAVVLDAMRFVLASGQDFRYISVMSGQDYPIKSMRLLVERLSSTYPAEYFQVADMAAWPEGVSRYRRFYLNDWSIRGRVKLERLINRMIADREFYPGLVPYGQSAWFTCTDRFVRFCLDFVNNNPGFPRFMKSVWCPDEFFFNTIVMNSDFRERVVVDNLRHIRFFPGQVSPKTFTIEDVDELMASNRFLARKFDADVDTEVLDQLDTRIQ